MKKSEALWADEFKKAGWEKALLSRIDFHGGLFVGMIAEDVGVATDVVLGHIKKLTKKGLVYFDIQNGDLASEWHIKRVLVGVN